MTDCPQCHWAELSRFGRLKERLLELWEPPITAYIRGMNRDLLGGMLGYKPKTWYQRHYDLYVATGDPLEIVRMNRHITKGGDVT